MCRCLKVITEKFRRYMKEKNVLQRIKKRCRTDVESGEEYRKSTTRKNL